MGRREGAYAVTRQLELSPATVLGGANSVTYVANPITSPFGEQLEEVLKDWAAIKLTADATADTGGNGLNEPRSRTCRTVADICCRRQWVSGFPFRRRTVVRYSSLALQLQEELTAAGFGLTSCQAAPGIFVISTSLGLRPCTVPSTPGRSARRRTGPHLISLRR